MTIARPIVVATCLSLSLTTACATNEQTGGLLGAGGGALLGGLAGNAIGHNAAGTLIGAAIGGAAGYFVGSAIGRQLDAADRARAEAATQAALAQSASQKRPVTWKSDHSGTTGSAQVVSVQKQASGGECRTVREVAYIKGQEVPQDSTYCRAPDGSWVSSA